MIFLQKKMRMTSSAYKRRHLNRMQNSFRPVLDAAHCTTFHLVAAHCKMGEIFLLENGFEKILDIEVENGAYS